MSRDDFSAKTKDTLAKQVAYHCSNPDCEVITIGPHSDEDKSASIGIAAHICAAAPGGPRYDANMTPAQRMAAKNGIWLCSNCSIEIDRDEIAYPAGKLHEWKQKAIALAKSRKGKRQTSAAVQLHSNFVKRVWQANNTSRFHFSARATDVFGRDAEFAALKDFCLNHANFKWWLLTGKGGMGKSRLAFELGELLAKQDVAWYWQFLGNDSHLKANLQKISDGQWQPLCDTLLIADYAAGAAEQLQRAIITLASKPLPYRVRLLIIERTLDGGWYDKLRSTGSGNENALINDNCHNPTPLALGALSLDYARTILNEVFKRYATAPKVDVDDLLERLDAEHRPLLILFLADALQEGQQQMKWDYAALISEVLKRERVRWKEQGVLPVDEELLCFATLAGDIAFNESMPPYVKALFKQARTTRNPPFKNRIAAAAYQGGDDNMLHKLEPDLLGELFVLESVVLDEDGWDDEIDKPLLEAAWQITFGGGTAEMIIRAAQDFPTHPKLQLLLERWIHYCPEDELAQLVLGMVHRDVGIIMSIQGNVAATKTQYSILRTMAISKSNAIFALFASELAFNLINAYGNGGDIALRQALYEGIAALAKRFRDNQAIALVQGQAAVNLIVDYGNNGDVALGQALYKDIAALTLHFPDNLDIALEQGKAAFNLIVDYGKGGDVASCQALYKDIATLALHFPDKQELVLRQGQAAFNLIFHLSQADKWEQVRPFIAELLILLEQYPHHPGFDQIRQMLTPR